jgi:hypothetical protein
MTLQFLFPWGGTSYKRTTKVIPCENKLNTLKVLDKYKIFPKNKARMSIPLCRLLTMLVVRSTFKIDMLKMEHTFFTRYHEGERAFYVFFQNWKVRKKILTINMTPEVPLDGKEFGILEVPDRGFNSM